MKAAIYMRTATRTGGNARQAEQCRALAAERGWDVTAIFADDGVSASAFSHPGLDAAMQQVRNRKYDVLIASAASRLTRDASGLASILADADASGVTIATADGMLETGRDASAG